MKTFTKFFGSSVVFTFLGLALAGAVGYYYVPTLDAALRAVFIVGILSVLEISISFDNAVVNATVLKDMSPLWQHRFLTWGMWIAVFGMRLVFPLMIVSLVAKISPWQALSLAAFKPQEYAQVMLSVHHEVAAFGAAFLMLVALKYFFNQEKLNHWIKLIESPMVSLGRLEAIEVGVVLVLLVIFSRLSSPEVALGVLYAGVGGILCFLAVEAVGEFLKIPEKSDGQGLSQQDIHRASLGMFLYLEVLDASFSFDGVIGAFAITNNLFIIAIGLGVGAMFVRSLTLLMVEKGTLHAYEYLEHGAFYAVGALASMMFLGIIVDIPEWITGLLGAGFIGLSIVSSILDRKKRA